jgi:hypothetical protein
VARARECGGNGIESCFVDGSVLEASRRSVLARELWCFLFIPFFYCADAMGESPPFFFAVVSSPQGCTFS